MKADLPTVEGNKKTTNVMDEKLQNYWRQAEKVRLGGGTGSNNGYDK